LSCKQSLPFQEENNKARGSSQKKESSFLQGSSIGEEEEAG
jgi:hypothetical protein